MKPDVRMISFPVHGDSRGELIALESGREIPFDIKRTYYIYNTTEGISRGFHAHKELKQVLIAVSGVVKIRCEYNNCVKEVFLDSPTKGLLIEGLVWREMHDFSKDCVLLVLASGYYTEEDYIRNYDIFKMENNNA